MKIRLYFDEDSMDKALVSALRARGLDVTTALEEDFLERSDEDHLDFATDRGRVLFSFNVADFYRHHTRYLQEGESTAGSSSPASRSTPWGNRCAVSCAWPPTCLQRRWRIASSS